MPITLTCEACGKQFRARDESVGKRVKCPYCARPTEVPVTAAGSGSSPFSSTITSSGGEHGGLVSSSPSLTPGTGWEKPAAATPTSTSDTAHVPRLTPVATAEVSAASREPAASVPSTLTHADFADPPRSAFSTPLGSPPAPPVTHQTRSTDYNRWRKVRAGLTTMAIGLWWLMIPGVVELGKVLYVRFGQELPQGTGWVRIPGYINDAVPGAIEMSKLQQLDILLYGLPVLLGGLFLGFGRLTCGAIPHEVGARGAFAGSGLFTLLSMAGILTAGGAYMLLLRNEATTALIATLLLAGLAEVWCLIALCSTALHLQQPQTTRWATRLVAAAGLWIGWILYGQYYYTSQWRPQLAAQPNLPLWELAIFSTAYVLTVIISLRAVANTRKAVRRHIQS